MTIWLVHRAYVVVLPLASFPHIKYDVRALEDMGVACTVLRYLLSSSLYYLRLEVSVYIYSFLCLGDGHVL